MIPLQVVRRLPLLPRGVDPDNPRVAPIVRRLAFEGGALTACDTIRDQEALLLERQPERATAANRHSAAAAAEAAERMAAGRAAAVVAASEGKVATLAARREALEAEVWLVLKHQKLHLFPLERSKPCTM